MTHPKRKSFYVVVPVSCPLVATHEVRTCGIVVSVAPASSGPNSSHTESTKHGDVFSATTSCPGSSG